MTTNNVSADDACRYCRGTGRERSVEFRNGYSVEISEPCFWCRGCGLKTFVLREQK